MKHDTEFANNLNKLESFRINPVLADFFETIEKLKLLDEKIKETPNGKSAETAAWYKQAQTLTKRLEDAKNEIAMRTKTQKEYDAVYDCIDFLNKYFKTA